MHRRTLFQALPGLVAAALLATVPPARAQGLPVADIAAYPARLAQYEAARAAYEMEASAYWDEVVAKRRLRNDKRRAHAPIEQADYVLTQPPVYSGPPRPVNPAAPAAAARRKSRRSR